MEWIDALLGSPPVKWRATDKPSPVKRKPPSCRTVQVLVERVEVAAGVLVGVPVKHKLHALSGLPGGAGEEQGGK